jgi:hypothetical protein
LFGKDFSCRKRKKLIGNVKNDVKDSFDCLNLNSKLFIGHFGWKIYLRGTKIHSCSIFASKQCYKNIFKVASNSEEGEQQVGDNQGVQIEEPGPPASTVDPTASNTSPKIEDLYLEEDMDQSRVNPQRNRYPFCIVWTPIPLLT